MAVMWELERESNWRSDCHRDFFQKRGQESKNGFLYSPTTGTPATTTRLSHGRQRTDYHPPHQCRISAIFKPREFLPVRN